MNSIRDELKNKFEYVEFNGVTGYLIRENGLYGLLGLDGKKIISKPNYEQCQLWNVNGEGIIRYIAKKDRESKFVLLDDKLNVISGNEFDYYECSIDDIWLKYLTIHIKDSNGCERIGVIDCDGQNVVECNFKDVISVDDNTFVVTNDGFKQALYRKNNGLVTDFLYNKIYIDSSDIIRVSNGDSFGYITKEGRVVVDIDVRITEADEFSSKKYARIIFEGKRTYINDKGEFIFKFDHQDAIEVDDEIFKVIVNDKIGIYDNEGRELLSPKYDTLIKQDSIYIVEVNKKWGIADIVYGEMTDICYDGITYYNSVNRLVVKKDDKFGIIDMDGNELTQLVYHYIGDLSEKPAVAVKNGKCGYLNFDGSHLTDFIYEDVLLSFVGNITMVRESDKYACMNIQGDIISDFKYDAASPFGDKGILVSADGKYGIVVGEGEEIYFQCISESAGVFDNAIYFACSGEINIVAMANFVGTLEEFKDLVVLCEKEYGDMSYRTALVQMDSIYKENNSSLM